MFREDLYRPWFAKLDTSNSKAEDDWGFEIISGDYSGTVVQIQKVNFPDDEVSSLAIDYHIIKKPENLFDQDLKDELFASVFETIINDILTEAIQNYKDPNEQNRNDNIKESNSL